ncbi:MAG: hypothetical protein DCC49_10060 [Acidobacteria bacterium]|nr:MAG: hypothetical protein DCC49_10060 [Acidobacteriota bacterium]
MTWPPEGGLLEIGAGDLENYERCPQQFSWTKARRQGTRTPSRALERTRAVTNTIALAHRTVDPPPPELLRDLFKRANQDFTPANPEERDAILEVLDNYSEIAVDLGGEFIDVDDDFRKRKSKRRPVIVSSWEPLLFDHTELEETTIESRRLSTSRYRGMASEAELHREFRTHIRHLVVEAAFPKAVVRVCEVNIVDGTHACVERGTELLAESAESAFRLEALLREEVEFEPRLNYLCGTCQYMPACKAVPSMESPWG